MVAEGAVWLVGGRGPPPPPSSRHGNNNLPSWHVAIYTVCRPSRKIECCQHGEQLICSKVLVHSVSEKWAIPVMGENTTSCTPGAHKMSSLLACALQANDLLLISYTKTTDPLISTCNATYRMLVELCFIHSFSLLDESAGVAPIGPRWTTELRFRIALSALHVAVVVMVRNVHKLVCLVFLVTF